MIEQHKQKTIFSLPILITTLVVLFILFAIGCGLDFNISKGLFASNKTINSIIGGAISNIGLDIGNFVVFTAGIGFVMSSYVYKEKQKWKTITTNAIIIPGLIIFAVICGWSLSEWTAVAGTKAGGIVINLTMLLITISGALCLNLFAIKKLNQENVFKAMFWLLIFLICVSIFRTLLCIIWSRPRPKIVFDDKDPLAFRPVWLPDPFRCYDKAYAHRSLCKSFPSGHTAMSGSIIGLMIVLIKLNTFKKRQISLLILIVAIFIMLLTAFGRMLAGWHFLTDVSFGGLLALSTYAGLSALLTKRKIG